jgi:NAD(P)-dependent dehydrogenase (short-subunit alcohol dehydrogenase family)
LVKHGGRVVVADLPNQSSNFARLASVACAEAAAKNSNNVDGGDRPILAFAETDVTDEDQVKAALDMAETEFGEPGLYTYMRDYE